MKKDYFEEERYLAAQKRVKDIKGFYIHLFWYIIVNLFITFGGPIISAFNDGGLQHIEIGFGNFSVWIFWGIGLAAHWLGVFGKNIVFSKDWEERKMKEFMDKDKFN